jgi:hypothetical protein
MANLGDEYQATCLFRGPPPILDAEWCGDHSHLISKAYLQASKLELNAYLGVMHLTVQNSYLCEQCSITDHPDRVSGVTAYDTEVAQLGGGELSDATSNTL